MIRQTSRVLYGKPSVIISIVILTASVANGLPSSARRYSYNDDEDRGLPVRGSPINTPNGFGGGGYGAGYGSGYRPGYNSGYPQPAASGFREVGEHQAWCPLRRRDPIRPVQRLAGSGRTPGSSYFNYPTSDDTTGARFGRLQRPDSDVRPASNNFDDDDSSEVSSPGTNVGGILWPRHSTLSKYGDGVLAAPVYSGGSPAGCAHVKIATLAKDATAAASDAAQAAATAARAAAAAAAAAACSPDDNIIRIVPAQRDSLEDPGSDDSEEESQDRRMINPVPVSQDRGNARDSVYYRRPDEANDGKGDKKDDLDDRRDDSDNKSKYVSDDTKVDVPDLSSVKTSRGLSTNVKDVDMRKNENVKVQNV